MTRLCWSPAQQLVGGFVPPFCAKQSGHYWTDRDVEPRTRRWTKPFPANSASWLQRPSVGTDGCAKCLVEPRKRASASALQLIASDGSSEARSLPWTGRCLLCIELGAMVPVGDTPGGANNPDEERPSPDPSLADFFERLRVHVSVTKQQIVLVYFFEGTLKEARELLERFPIMAEPDVLCTLCGTEIYQRGYVAPDPYWEQRMAAVGLGFDPKPIAWMMRESFEKWLTPEFDEKLLSKRKLLTDPSAREVAYLEYSWRSDPDEAIDRAHLIESVQGKMKEMGFEATRCIVSPLAGNLVLIPDEARMSKCLQFIMLMMRLTTADLVLVGSESSALLQDAVQVFESSDPVASLEALAPDVRKSQWTDLKPGATGSANAERANRGTLVLLPSASGDVAVNFNAPDRCQVVKASQKGAAGIIEALLALGKL